MPSAHPTIARIRLTRSLPRLLALPTLGLLVGLAAIAGGLLLVPGTLGLVVAGAGAALAALAVVGFALPLSVRLEIEESAVRVSWLGGERIYVLSPGPVTRVRLRGENASSLRGGRRLLGGQLGSARLRGEEQIDVVRLAPTATAILIPTDRGRLAIAAASEELLLDALSHAARARQRLEELEREVPPAEEPPPPVEVEVDPALMTGIERALHERQMADEREAAEAAALAQLAAAEAAANTEAAAAAAGMAEAQASTVAKPRRRLGLALGRPRPSSALVLLPLVGAGAAWGIGLLLDRMPDPGSEVGRLTALALVLAGPAATVGAIMARVWWPRLVGVVVAGGLAAAVFVGRSLIGA
jgi:hypothetical protein